MKRRQAAMMGVAAVIIATAVSLLMRPAHEPASEPVPAPDFALADLGGRSVRLSSFRGKVVLLDFWATWCGPCQEELPDLKALHEKYKSKGFVVVGVSMDALGREVVAPFVKDNAVPYPILLGGNEPPAGYPVPGFPTAFLIDRSGMVLERYLGPMTFEEFSQDVEKALAR